MNILITDSGSSKSSWALISGNVHMGTVQTAGLNPYFHNPSSVESVVFHELLPFLDIKEIHEIHFYGAGCSTENKNRMISDALLKFFPLAYVSVLHDNLGAARALFGHDQGISCILGTGCNCCYYDGKEIYQKMDSLGYLFGDEGAGSYLGRHFLKAYLKKQLPGDLRKEFTGKYKLTLEEILNSVYNLPYPNRFLASFSEFLAPRQKHPYILELVRNSFKAFFEAQVRQYEGYRDLPVSFTGSIAFYYQEILRSVASEEGITVGTIIQAPLEGLIRFHAGRRT